MTFQYRHRKQIRIIGIILILLIGTISSILYYHPISKKEKKEEIVKKKEPIQKETKEEETIKVDIKGQVAFPGIYSLPIHSRVVDVIEKAGGLTEFADISVINLSKKIQDEMVIIVYSREEVAQFQKTKEIEKVVQEKCHQVDENSLVNNACIENQIISSSKISINTGTKEELMTLPGIGESKAKDIINYREANGPFQSIEDLKKVPGIGDSIFAKIQENITL